MTHLTSTPRTATNDRTGRFTFECNEPPCAFACKLDSEPSNACASPYEATAPLAQATHAFPVRGRDAAGNVETASVSFEWTIDLAAPEMTLTAQPDAPVTRTSTARFAFSCNEACDFECRCPRGQRTTCAGSTVCAGVPDGDNTFELWARDLAGNETHTGHTWTVDTRTPTSTITAGPTRRTSERPATFAFECDEVDCRFDCRLDDGAPEPCASPLAYPGLSSGAHVLSVLATDPAGNVESTPATYRWAVVGRWAHVAAGQEMTCAVGTDETLWCWGLRVDDSGVARTAPQQMDPRTGWREVASGYRHGYGLFSDASLWCWGWNSAGQLGDGSTSDRTTPTRAPGYPRSTRA